MIVENHGFHHGYKTKKDRLKIETALLEMYYPSSEKWRSKAIQDARKLLSRAVKNYALVEK